MSRNRQILAWAVLLSLGPITAWIAIRKGRSEVVANPSLGEDRVGDAEEETRPAGLLDPGIAEVADMRESAAILAGIEPTVPRLVAGLVVDEAGLPVPDADVTVYETPDQDRTSSRIVARTESDGEGRFQVGGVHTRLHLEVRGSKPGFTRSTGADFMRGAKDVKLVLRRGGVVAGRILVGAGIAVDGLRVRIERASDDPIFVGPWKTLERGDTGTIPDPSGDFLFEGVSHRDVDLFVEADDSARFVVSGIRVRGAGESPDPRLDPLDLRGLFETLSIRVLDDAGRPCDGARVVVRPAFDGEKLRSKLTCGGVAEFLTRAGPHDLEVELAGWRRGILSGVDGEQVVRLRKGIPVRLSVRGTIPSTAPSAQLFVGLFPVDRPNPSADDICALDKAHEARLFLSLTGPHEIAWYVERGNIRSYLAGTPRRTIQIADQEAEQFVTLDLPPDVREAWVQASLEKGRSEEDDRPNMRLK